MMHFPRSQWNMASQTNIDYLGCGLDPKSYFGDEAVRGGGGGGEGEGEGGTLKRTLSS